MRVYADSSFLVSCYLVDANTARAKAFLSEHSGPLPFTIATVEWRCVTASSSALRCPILIE